ncbi:acyltransferase family protein [Pseudoduganella danionis]|uniref:acyltransferase family protein n=1 Tax=Pseudoduganella danionis TaxID=1890295 RepID=UPI0018B0432A|nr:acyltransferase [Pseudoduganella danionis]
MKFLFSAPLIDERITETGGRATGFDYLRIGLAALVICFHSMITSYGSSFQEDVTHHGAGRAWYLILPMFFALSGFLVAGSLERSKSIGVFLGLRVFRIFPALAMDTLVCALLLGPMLTTLPLGEYFSNSTFHQYFQNILGIIHFELPGVFETNPSHKVNGQLWTIPVELECYITLTVLGILGLHRRRFMMLAAFLALFAYSEWQILSRGDEAYTGRILLLSFCAGVAFYQFRDYIRLNLLVAILALAISLLCLTSPQGGYLLAVPVTYLTVYLGLRNPPKSHLLETGDYSYGLFLYGYPIQQTMVFLFPFAHTWWGNLVLSIPMALLFAVASWHLVEKRVLKHKTILFTADKWYQNKVQQLKG